MTDKAMFNFKDVIPVKPVTWGFDIGEFEVKEGFEKFESRRKFNTIVRALPAAKYRMSGKFAGTNHPGLTVWSRGKDETLVASWSTLYTCGQIRKGL